MTFKPMTYLVSFTAFVLLFMGLGGWVGYTKLAEHFLAQAYLEALPIRLSVQRDEKGAVVRWQDKVALQAAKTEAEGKIDHAQNHLGYHHDPKIG